ncbi:MAG: molybdopterin molybdotransferase MoeA [Pseudomonadota bacterium]
MTAPAAGPSWLTVDDALAQVLDGALPRCAQGCSLPDAHGRTLAADVQAVLANPPDAVSAMDGYALRRADLKCATALDLIGEAAAGAPFEGVCGASQAVRIFTGAVIPAGADHVVPQEDVLVDGTGQILPSDGARAGDFIRRAGADFARGSVLLKAGQRLNARDVLVAATAGVASVQVRHRPRVGVLSTGDELVTLGSTPGSGEIVSSSPLALTAMLSAWGAAPIDLGIARDTLADLTAKLEAAQDTDVLVTIGGASVGERDLAREALSAAGYDMQFWRIAMRPGKPLFLAKRGGQRVVGLPGNPVSALICARVFLMPLVSALLGKPSWNAKDDEGTPTGLLNHYWPCQRGTVTTALEANGPRLHFMRARAELNPANLVPALTPFASQDSGRTHLLSQADGVIMRQPHAPAVPAGGSVDYHPFDF